MTLEQLSSLPDHDLAEACLSGNSRAWEALLQRYQRLIYSIPIHYGFQEHDANDIFQNVSILLLENLSHIRDRNRLGAWLVITTRRECWRVLRRNKEIPLDLDADIPSDHHANRPKSEDDYLLLERQSVIRSAVGQLGAPCQQLLTLLFYVEPRPPYAEIAQMLTLPEGSIGPTRARCLEKLMRILERLGLTEP